MSTPSANYHRATRGLSARYAFLRHFNADTLAFVLFVALALLSTTRAKEPQNNEFAHTGGTDAELVTKASDTSMSAREEIHTGTVSAKNLWNRVPPNR